MSGSCTEIEARGAVGDHPSTPVTITVIFHPSDPAGYKPSPRGQTYSGERACVTGSGVLWGGVWKCQSIPGLHGVLGGLGLLTRGSQRGYMEVEYDEWHCRVEWKIYATNTAFLWNADIFTVSFRPLTSGDHYWNVLTQAHFPPFIWQEPDRMTRFQSNQAYHWRMFRDYLATQFPLLGGSGHRPRSTNVAPECGNPLGPVHCTLTVPFNDRRLSDDGDQIPIMRCIPPLRCSAGRPLGWEAHSSSWRRLAMHLVPSAQTRSFSASAAPRGRGQRAPPFSSFVHSPYHTLIMTMSPCILFSHPHLGVNESILQATGGCRSQPIILLSDVKTRHHDILTIQPPSLTVEPSRPNYTYPYVVCNVPGPVFGRYPCRGLVKEKDRARTPGPTVG